MSGSGNNKITSVLGASTVSAVGSIALESNNADNKWVILSISISVGLAMLALLLKLLSTLAKKRAK